MSSAMSSTSWDRPDRPLVVKCSFSRSMRRVTFGSALDCTFDLLRMKVEQCFSLYGSAFLISYTDDDGEVTDISSDHDLTEAINYFSDGDESVAYSGGSSSSSRSASTKKVTLRVKVALENDGPSLSDTASLASLEDYVRPGDSSDRRQPRFDGSAVPRSDGPLEDDAVTISSGNFSGSFLNVQRPQSRPNEPGRIPLPGYALPTISAAPPSPPDSPGKRPYARSSPFDQSSETLLAGERLKRLGISDRNPGPSRSPGPSRGQELDDNGNPWVFVESERGQSRQHLVANGSELMEADLSAGEDPFGDAELELQRGTTHYYYEYPADYTSQSGGSSGHGSIRASRPKGKGSGGDQSVDLESLYISNNQQTSPHGLAWIESQQMNLLASSSRLHLVPEAAPHEPDPSVSLPLLQHRYPGVPLEVLRFVPDEQSDIVGEARVLTDCSNCGALLEDFRYVCTSCGEKEGKQQDHQHDWHDRQLDLADAYSVFSESTVHGATSHSGSSAPSHDGSSIALVDLSQRRQTNPNLNRPLPPLPTLTMPEPERGFELCASCVHAAGMHHALSATETEGPSPSAGSPSTSGSSTAGSSNGTPTRGKRKNPFRHAFREMMWGPTGWKDLEYEDSSVCSTCLTSVPGDRYKCLSCEQFYLCRGCYSQVHHIHPAHVFLFVASPPSSEEGTLGSSSDADDPDTLGHPGVKCTHCLQDIVGARFHCAICSSVDICANCEAAGLPGNLTAPDGGHDDSHIMIKIPYPLDSVQVESASRRARNLWSERNGLSLNVPFQRQRSNSSGSDSMPTVVGLNTDESARYIYCRGCNELIEGVRYQCAHCPSLPTSYSLCANCEPRSYDLHDPMHAFFKIPRPLDRPINSPFAILPLVYKTPVAQGFEGEQDPKAYLRNVLHGATLCDCCVERIRGEWYRCVYCSADLCSDCEGLDVHDPTHIFVVFKAPIDMNALKVVTDIANPMNSRPLLPFQVYGSGSPA